MRWVFILVAAVALACGSDDGDTGGEGEGSGATSNTASTAPTGSGSGSQSATSAATTGGGPCGDTRCDDGMICINPCCGGSPSPCMDLPADGQCPAGSVEVDPDQCFGGACQTETCCLSDPCMPPPPFCVAAGDLECTDSFCSFEGCTGELSGSDLLCTCA